MSNVLVINATPQETRVAALENGVISEFYLDRRRNVGIVGNVYKGRVSRVLPGIQAAFVDIGLEKAGFLYVTDVYNDHTPHDLDDDDDDDDQDDSGGKGRGGRRQSRRKRDIPPIEDQLKEGQEVLVQVVKDPIGTKGARITCHITLPGRHLVFMPTVDHVGISRQIQKDRERKRLRDIANEMRPKGGGFIVRTASAGVASDRIRSDMDVLVKLWNKILRGRSSSKRVQCLHEDLDLILRATRDLATAELDQLIVDSREEYDRIIDFINSYMPAFANRVELYVGEEPIFDAYGIEEELRTAISREVPLPSGGSLVIEKTEALTSIDVNTGRFVGKKSLEETIAKTNVEAAIEIAYQLRLRNIGGLIIIDFIDMEDPSNREHVHAEFERALEGDRGRVKITRISEFGIIEMTRKRTRESLEQMLCEPCDVCQGSGLIKSRETVAYELLRELRRRLASIDAFDVAIVAHPAVLAAIESSERATIRELELRFNKKLRLAPDRSTARDTYDIAPIHPKDSAKSA